MRLPFSRNTDTVTLTQTYALAAGTDFTLTANNCGTASAPLSLAPGQTCQVTAAFAPTSGGTFSNRIQLLAKELPPDGVSQLVTVTAVGAVTASPSSLNFGSVGVGTSSSASVVTLTNTTGATRTLTIGAAPAGYARTTTCGATLANGASCTVSVSFTPASSGAISGTLSLSTDSSSHPVSLTGSGASNATLISPNFSLFYGERLWMETGHGWAWSTGGYSSNAAVGNINVQGLLTNSTGVARTVTLRYSVDNTMTSIRLNNAEVPRTACEGHTVVCTVSLNLPPGTSLLTLRPGNLGGPAGLSAWVMDGSTVMLSTSTTSGAGAWTRF